MNGIKKIEQPSVDFQALLDSIMEAEPTKVLFMGKFKKIGWLTNGTIRKFSHIMVKEENISKRGIKLAVVIMLNHYWKIKFLYGILWRWFYYIKDVDQVEVLRVIDAGKKKVPQGAYYLVTILQTAMMDVMMTMTNQEAKASQAGRSGAQPTHLAKSTDSSSKEDTELKPTTTGGDIPQPK